MKEIKRFFAFIAMALITSAPCYAQEWAITYGGSQGEYPSRIQQTSDGGYIMAVETYSFGAGDCDLWILKLNSDGTIAWQKTYGGSGDDRPRSIQQTYSGGIPDGYIVAGSTTSFGAGSSDLWILKLNSDGTIAWQKTYGGSSIDGGGPIQQTSGGGYIVPGETYSFGAGSRDFWILKLYPDGQPNPGDYGVVEWQKTYGGSSSDLIYSIQQTYSGEIPDGYILAGVTSSFGAGNSDVWILKVDLNGNVGPAYSGTWQQTYGTSTRDGTAAMQQTSDGGYILPGHTRFFDPGSMDFWILKLYPDGQPNPGDYGVVEWQKTYGGSGWEWPSRIQETSDGGYIVAGETSSFGAGGDDFWILKLYPDGQPNPGDYGVVEWQKTYGGSGHDRARSIWRTIDGRYIVRGYTNSFGAGDYDVWLLKLNSNGEIPGCTAMDSSANVNNISPEVHVTTVTPQDTSAIISDTTVSPSDISAETSWVCLNTPQGSDITVQPMDLTTRTTPVTITFEQVTEAGATSLTTSSEGPDPPSSFKFGEPPIYYDLTTTAEFPEGSQIEICIDYSGIIFDDEGEIELCHWEDTNNDGEPDSWVLLTPTLHDELNNIICANVDRLSLFAILEPTVFPADVIITDAYTTDQYGNRKTEFHREVPIQFHIEYDVLGDPSTEYKVKGIVRAWGKRYGMKQFNYPGTGYHMYKEKIVPMYVKPGKTKTITYKLKLKDPTGVLLDKDKATSQVYILPY